MVKGIIYVVLFRERLTFLKRQWESGGFLLFTFVPALGQIPLKCCHGNFVIINLIFGIYKNAVFLNTFRLIQNQTLNTMHLILKTIPQMFSSLCWPIRLKNTPANSKSRKICNLTHKHCIHSQHTETHNGNGTSYEGILKMDGNVGFAFCFHLCDCVFLGFI